MASYLFQALLLLFSVVFCALCGAGSADPANMSVVLFKEGPFDVSKLEGGGVGDFDVAHVFLPSLIGVGDVMVALVDVQKTGNTRNILAKYIGTGGDKWGDRAMEENGKNWKTQVAWKDDKLGRIASASVVRDNSIYVLSAASEAHSAPQEATNTKAWDFHLTVGTITSGADAAEKKIGWKTQIVSDSFVTGIPQKFRDASPVAGSAFLTEDGTFVFVLSAFNNKNKKSSFAVARSKNLKDDFKVSYVANTAHCYSSFFSWDNQLFMVPGYCPDNEDDDYEIKVSSDMGETWGEATAPLAKKLDTGKKRRSSFTRITIEGERVLLFTQVVSEPNDPSVKKNLTLIVADEEHNEDLGLIVANVSSPVIGPFLYTDDELFFLGIVDNGTEKIIFVRLKEQLGKIKRLAKKWSAEKRAKRPGNHSPGPQSSGVPVQQETEDHPPAPHSSGVPVQQKTEDYSAGPLCSLTLTVFFFCCCVLFGM